MPRRRSNPENKKPEKKYLKIRNDTRKMKKTINYYTKMTHYIQIQIINYYIQILIVNLQISIYNSINLHIYNLKFQSFIQLITQCSIKLSQIIQKIKLPLQPIIQIKSHCYTVSNSQIILPIKTQLLIIKYLSTMPLLRNIYTEEASRRKTLSNPIYVYMKSVKITFKNHRPVPDTKPTCQQKTRSKSNKMRYNFRLLPNLELITHILTLSQPSQVKKLELIARPRDKQQYSLVVKTFITRYRQGKLRLRINLVKIARKSSKLSHLKIRGNVKLYPSPINKSNYKLEVAKGFIIQARQFIFLTPHRFNLSLIHI